MIRSSFALLMLAAAAPAGDVAILGDAELFAPDIASTSHSEVRLTIDSDGRTALWFSRDRPGGAGGYDIWMSRRTASGWAPAAPVPFNSPGRDFDPAFSRDGRFVFFSSDRPGGLGGDDVWRVAVTRAGFGKPVNLGSAINSAGREWAPMLSPEGSTLLFSSDRPGGAGQQDLYTARATSRGFAPAVRLPGTLNTKGYEFDATFLRDSRTIVYAHAPDIAKDRIDLFVSAPRDGRYDEGHLLPRSVNGDADTYGPMLDWSAPDRLTFSSQRDPAKSMDLYRIRYRVDAGT
jgi:TolB protein